MVCDKKMMISRDKVMPLIQDLARAYNKTDDDIIVLENTKDSFFILYDETDNPVEIKPKPKCGDCKYLDLSDKHVVGYRCNRPNFTRMWDSAAFKQKCCPACKGFERKEE